MPTGGGLSSSGAKGSKEEEGGGGVAADAAEGEDVAAGRAGSRSPVECTICLGEEIRVCVSRCLCF